MKDATDFYRHPSCYPINVVQAHQHMHKPMHTHTHIHHEPPLHNNSALASAYLTVISVSNILKARASITIGQGERHIPNIWTGRHYHKCPPIICRSQVKLCLLISWHFISPKHIFTLMMTKKLQLPGDFIFIPPDLLQGFD